MRRYIYLSAVALLISANAFAQNSIKITKLTEKDIPEDITYKGKITSAVRWTDKLGDNIVINTETGNYKSKSSEMEDAQDAALFSAHYIIKPDSIIRTWRVMDHIENCPVDVQVNFIRNSFQVTDLDKDGIAEVWVMYKTACHGDMSPCDMKIIMYEGKQKYAMRGENKIKISEKETYGGQYKMDGYFLNGPKVFSNFAKKLWQKNIMEEWYNG